MKEATLIIAVIFIAVAVLGGMVVIFVNGLCNTIKARRIYELLACEYGEHEGVFVEWLCFQDYGRGDFHFRQIFFHRNLKGLLFQIEKQALLAASTESRLKPYCELSRELVNMLLKGHCHFLSVNPKIGGRKAWLQASLETIELNGDSQPSKVIRILAMTNTDKEILERVGLI